MAERGEGGAPSARRVARLALILLAICALSAALYATGHWVLGTAAAVLAAGFALVSWGIGSLMVRVALRPVGRPRAAGGKQGPAPADAVVSALAGALLGGPGTSEAAGEVAAQARADLEARGIDPQDPAERALDRAVGPMLCLLPPMEAEFGSALDEAGRAALRAARLEERRLTGAWLREAGPWEEVSVEAEDGARLAGHVIEARGGSGRWAVLAHGYRGSWRETILYARRWAAAGRSLLLVEQRAHGASGGGLVGMGWLERRDLVAWCRWLSGARGASSVVLHGHSMGGAAVCLASGEPDLPACVSSVVSDCAYSSAWGAFEGLLASTDTPAHPTLDLMRLRLRAARGGYDIALADPRRALARPGVPVLLFHGEQDPSVPPAMAGELLEAARAGGRRAELHMVPGAGHCQSALAAGQGYFDRVLDFVEG